MDKYINKELCLHDCDLSLDTGEKAHYAELWIRPKERIEGTRLYHCEMVTGDQFDGRMIKVSKDNLDAINWRYEDSDDDQ